ncbi:MAG: hypothetical protein ACFFG0_02715 [Candidatus Thorarchaeota archaeon]
MMISIKPKFFIMFKICNKWFTIKRLPEFSKYYDPKNVHMKHWRGHNYYKIIGSLFLITNN